MLYHEIYFEAPHYHFLKDKAGAAEWCPLACVPLDGNKFVSWIQPWHYNTQEIPLSWGWCVCVFYRVKGRRRRRRQKASRFPAFFSLPTTLPSSHSVLILLCSGACVEKVNWPLLSPLPLLLHEKCRPHRDTSTPFSQTLYFSWGGNSPPHPWSNPRLYTALIHLNVLNLWVTSTLWVIQINKREILVKLDLSESASFT